VLEEIRALLLYESVRFPIRHGSFLSSKNKKIDFAPASPETRDGVKI
jgi:hypothetical protein